MSRRNSASRSNRDRPSLSDRKKGPRFGRPAAGRGRGGPPPEQRPPFALAGPLSVLAPPVIDGPRLLAMAGQAVLLPAGMRRTMTAPAARDLDEIGPAPGPGDGIRRGMADGAVLGPEMGALKHGSGLAMIEVRGIERDDGLLAALMLGVADGAVLGLIPMVARPGGDPRGDLAMTSQAFDGSHLGRGGVASGAGGVSRLRGMGRAQGPRGLLRRLRLAPEGREGCGGEDGEKRQGD